MKNSVDKQYLAVLKDIVSNGVEKESGRANMPNTMGVSNATIKMDLSEGFPLLTTKKMFYKGIIHELLWFLRGETNIKYLVDNNVNIWNGDGYRWFKKLNKDAYGTESEMSMEDFIGEVKKGTYIDNKDMVYKFGNLGKVYGHQWRNQNGVDQVAEVLNLLKSNPYSRYQIIDGWNKADFPEMALPPCHLLYQFIVRPLTEEERNVVHMQGKGDSENVIGNHSFYDGLNIPKYYLDLNMYQRSCDTMLGVPFNIASMSLLLHIFAKVTGMVPGIATWIGGDTHLYVNHLSAVEEQLSREPMDLCNLDITKEINTLEDIENLTIDDFVISDYKSHPSIKAELFTGNKK